MRIVFRRSSVFITNGNIITSSDDCKKSSNLFLGFQSYHHLLALNRSIITGSSTFSYAKKEAEKDMTCWKNLNEDEHSRISWLLANGHFGRNLSCEQFLGTFCFEDMCDCVRNSAVVRTEIEIVSRVQPMKLLNTELNNFMIDTKTKQLQFKTY